MVREVEEIFLEKADLELSSEGCSKFREKMGGRAFQAQGTYVYKGSMVGPRDAREQEQV